MHFGPTSFQVTGVEPSFHNISALCAAWSESTLAYLHQMSCEDPMTGLTSLAHVRTRLSELYRGDLRAEGSTQLRYALVLADLPKDAPGVGSLSARDTCREPCGSPVSARRPAPCSPAQRPSVASANTASRW